MNAVEHVYAELAGRGIDVFTCPLGGRKSVCSADGFIGVNPENFGSAAAYTDAIHNDGHFLSGAFYHPYSPCTVRAQAEYRADKAAALKYVPPAALAEQCARGRDVWEIADYFHVTPEFLWRVWHIYRDHMRIL